jgi:hypothetical protein
VSTLPLFDSQKRDTQKLTDLALAASPSMIEVTKEQFFDCIGPRNVSPSAYGSSKDELGIYSIFKTVHGDAVGKIFGGDHISDSVFLLRTDLAKATP